MQYNQSYLGSKYENIVCLYNKKRRRIRKKVHDENDNPDLMKMLLMCLLVQTYNAVEILPLACSMKFKIDSRLADTEFFPVHSKE